MSRFLRPSGPQNLRELWYAIWKGFQRTETELGDGVPEEGYPEPPDAQPSPPDGQQPGAHSHYLDNLINVDIAPPGAPAAGVNGIGAKAINLLSGQVLTFKDDLNYWENATVASEAIPTGLIDGGELNIGPGANDIEVIAGVGVIMDSYTDPDGPPQAKGVSWNQINQTITQVPAAGNLAYFTIIPVTPETPGPVVGTVLGELKEYDTVPPNQVQRRDEIPLGLVVFNGDTWGEISSPTVINNVAHTVEDYLNSVSGPSFIIEGGEITEAPAHTFDQSSGTVWEQNRNWHVNKKDPHREAFLARTPVQFRYTNRDFSDVEPLSSTVDVTQWDDAGTVSSIGGGSSQATIQRVYIDPRDNVWILWGQNIYPSYSDAVSNIGRDTANTEVPPLLAGASILLCYIVSRRNQTDWGAESAIVIPEGGSGGGGSPFTPTTFSGALTTGYVPDPLTESERTLIDDGTWQNRVHAKSYVAGNTYYPQDMVFEGGWLMVANKETTDQPDPQPVGDPTTSLPDVPAFQEFSNTSVVFSGHLYTFTQSGYFRGLRVWVPELSATTNYNIVIVRNPNSANPTYTAINDPILVENDWTILAVDTTLVLAGEELLVYIDALNSGSNVQPGGTPTDWVRATNSNTATPLAGEWNTNVQETLLRINEIDADGNPAVDLTGTVPGTTFQFVDINDPNTSITFLAQTGETLAGGVYSWNVAIDSVGTNGAPGSGTRTLTTIIVPIAASTKFVGIPAYWGPGTLPPWAGIESFLQYDGVAQPVVGDEAYGIDVSFQILSASPDWDIYGLPSGGGGGGGGGGGDIPDGTLDGQMFRWDQDAGAAGWTSDVIVTDDGNVGIGTETPVEQTNQTTVTVDGTAGSQIRCQNQTDSAYFSVAAVNNEAQFITNTAVPMVFYQILAERMRINSGGQLIVAGNTAIGTTAATYRFNVESTQAAIMRLETPTQSTCRLLMNNSATIGAVNNYIRFNGTAFDFIANGTPQTAFAGVDVVQLQTDLAAAQAEVATLQSQVAALTAAAITNGWSL